MNLTIDQIRAISRCTALPTGFLPVIVDSNTQVWGQVATGITCAPLPQGSSYRFTRVVTGLPGQGALVTVSLAVYRRSVDTAVLFTRTVSQQPPVPGTGGISDPGSLDSDGDYSGSVQFDLRPGDSAALPANTLCAYRMTGTDASGLLQVLERGTVYVLGTTLP